MVRNNFGHCGCCFYGPVENSIRRSHTAVTWQIRMYVHKCCSETDTIRLTLNKLTALTRCFVGRLSTWDLQILGYASSARSDVSLLTSSPGRHLSLSRAAPPPLFYAISTRELITRPLSFASVIMNFTEQHRFTELQSESLVVRYTRLPRARQNRKQRSSYFFFFFSPPSFSCFIYLLSSCPLRVVRRATRC